MRLIGLAVTAALGLAAGCDRPSQTTGPATPTIATGLAESGDGKDPKFLSEFVVIDPKGTEVARLFNGGADGGPPVATNLRHATGGGRSAVVYEIEFVAHRAGADVFKFAYTAPSTGGSVTRTKEVRYAGERLVLVQDEHGSAVLRPPSK
jgi:hypothetical protein